MTRGPTDRAPDQCSTEHGLYLNVSSHMRSARRLFALVLGFSICLPGLRAEERAFSDSLPAEQQKAAGLTHLKPEQLTTLNNLVKRELILAKQGDTRGFAAEFSRRRSAPELAKAGIDKLTPEERSRLDVAVAQAISNQPRAVPTTLASVQNSTASVQAVGPHSEIHGSVSFTVGTSGGGRNFYGGTVRLEQTDPVHGYTIAVAYSEFRGNGLYWPYGYGYGYNRGYGYGYGPGRFW